jgi:hypothetical protein
MRQQFDPRRLEEAVKQRCEAALHSAAEFDAAGALASSCAAGGDGGDEQPVRRAGSGRRGMKACNAGRSSLAHTPIVLFDSHYHHQGASAEQGRRWAHDAAQAHRLMRVLDAEKVDVTAHTWMLAGSKRCSCHCMHAVDALASSTCRAWRMMCWATQSLAAPVSGSATRPLPSR